MPDLFHGSSYSSGWKPLDRSNDNNEKLQSISETKLKELAAELDRTRAEYEERIKNIESDTKAVQTDLEIKLSKLMQVVSEKDEEIRRLIDDKNKSAAEYIELDNKYRQLSQQIVEYQNKGFFEPLLKKITNKKITPK